jgi:hypothetical protein
MAKNGEQFLYVFIRHLYFFFENFLFNLLAHLLVVLFVVLMLNLFLSSVYILDINPLSDESLQRPLPHSVHCLLILVIISCIKAF